MLERNNAYWLTSLNRIRPDRLGTRIVVEKIEIDKFHLETISRNDDTRDKVFSRLRDVNSWATEIIEGEFQLLFNCVESYGIDDFYTLWISVDCECDSDAIKLKLLRSGDITRTIIDYI